jgi:hypothetical protein
VFDQLQALLMDELGEAGGIDLGRVSIDSFSLRAVNGGLTGANPVDRGKAGSKLHLATDADGLPLSLIVSAANANDSTMLEAVLEDTRRSACPAAVAATGRPSSMPTRPTTIAVAGRICAGAGSGPASPGA